MTTTIDPTNPVVALCAAGMQMEGTPEQARRCFEEAWAARRDNYDACIAAHFLARHQPTPSDTLRWNALAVRHAEAVLDGRAAVLMASLYLNLGDSYAMIGDFEAAAAAADKGTASLIALPADGYRDFVEMGIHRLQQRLSAVDSAAGSLDSSRTT
jgi:hypothetical protein